MAGKSLVRGVAAIATLFALACARPVPAEAPADVSLRAGDAIALHKRLARFDKALPETERLGVERIVAYEEHRLFACVVGRSPAAAGAPAFVRRILLLKPDVLIVDDAVRVGDSPQPVRWRFRAGAAPEIRARSIRVREGDVALCCETVLPADAAPKREGDAPVAGVAAPGRDGWARFVHAIRVAEGEDAPAVRVERAEEGTGIALTIAAGDRTFRLTLPPAGAPSGSIAVSQADGKALLAGRLLPAGILPHGPDGVRLLDRWDAAYRRTRLPGWDVGRPAGELRKAVEDGTIRPGRAVVLGCGTGTNAVYLAERGFDVTGVDVAPTALAFAERRARKADVRVRWLLADVLAIPEIGTFDLLFDRGCYHHIRRYDAAGFVRAVCRLSREGTHFLLLAGNANEARHYGPPRVRESELCGDFAPAFAFRWLREMRFEGKDPEAKKGPMAWSVLLRRRAAEKPKPSK